MKADFSLLNFHKYLIKIFYNSLYSLFLLEI